jgi:hypothetical protein
LRFSNLHVKTRNGDYSSDEQKALPAISISPTPTPPPQWPPLHITLVFGLAAVGGAVLIVFGMRRRRRVKGPEIKKPHEHSIEQSIESTSISRDPSDSSHAIVTSSHEVPEALGGEDKNNLGDFVNTKDVALQKANKNGPPQSLATPPVVFVSYAWGDTSPIASEVDGKRQEMVERLCKTVQTEGWQVVRDKTAIRYGELISPFIDTLGQANLVIVIFSDKYLRSPYCMTELFSIYQRSLQKKEEFLRRIVPIALAECRIWHLEGPCQVCRALGNRIQRDGAEAQVPRPSGLCAL